jgi:hypothetical protein
MTAVSIFPMAQWLEGTNQNSTPANDNTLRMQAAVSPAKGFAASAPVSPAANDMWVVSTTWGGFTSGNVVIYTGGAWKEFAAYNGMTKVIGGSKYIRSGGSWTADSSGGGGSGATIVDARMTLTAVVDGHPGAAGTDNETVMAAGLAVLQNGIPYRTVNIQNDAGLDVHVSAKTPNPYGVRMGPGRLLQTGNFPSDPGRVQLNSDADWRGHTCGMEYLYYAQKKMQLRAGCEWRFMGDSTTAGDSIVNSYNTIDQMVKQLVQDHGFKITVTNAGHSGITTEQWRTTYLSADLAAAPDGMCIRYCVNDPGWKKDGTAGTLNAYESEYALRRDIGDFVTSMRAALTTIRAAKDVTALSIILMNGNSTADSPNGRDEKWYELTGAALRQCARDFQCAFIDTYAIWRDSRNAAGRWMDNAGLPSVDGRAIHPLDIMNQWIGGVISELIVPRGLEIRNTMAARAAPNISIAPSLFPIGYSTFDVTWTINGVAVTGMLINFRSVAGVSWQRLIDGSGVAPVSERAGNTTGDVWFDWISTPKSTAPLTLSNSWVAGSWGITFYKENGVVRLSGRLSNGTTTAGTTVATLPAGFRPAFDIFFVVACGAGASSTGVVTISTAGVITIVNVANNTYLDLGSISFPIF